MNQANRIAFSHLGASRNDVRSISEDTTKSHDNTSRVIGARYASEAPYILIVIAFCTRCLVSKIHVALKTSHNAHVETYLQDQIISPSEEVLESAAATP